MSPGPQNDDNKKRESFASGWTGVTTVVLFAYVVVAILLTFVDSQGSRALELVNLYSDSPASIGVTLLAASLIETGLAIAVRLDPTREGGIIAGKHDAVDLIG